MQRDNKASKIILDTNFNVKLGDFGLARLMDHDLRSHATGLVGSFGYIYVMTGRASKESDIYSFGVSMLEIVTGRKPVDHSQENIEAKSLFERVWDMYGRQQLLSALDEKLGEKFNREHAEYLVVMAVGYIWCGHHDGNSRSSVREVTQVLNLESPLPNLPQKMPVPIYYISPTSHTVRLSRGLGSVTFSSCLDTHLFGKRPHLCWDVRSKVVVGLASVLFYLHQEWDRCVMQRDNKGSKIILDTNFNVKLGRASKESDIYSFGDLYGRQQLLSALDEKLGEEFNREHAEYLVVVRYGAVIMTETQGLL
ncbi:hypothetical protein F2Q69_00019649 [Brassica cretica]|uniref:Protein kinase domain-containing protein n=1 Tax=Brassica cretica TaxID=69181 RepID=A0A8S9QGH2_BRACR|nr:hypothetical protein F2Q69_00019649 [Brassica cretica]